MEDERLKERWQLAAERIREIPGEEQAPEPSRAYFCWMARWIEQMIQAYREVEQGNFREKSLAQLQEENQTSYEDLLGGAYETSWGKPAYAAK